MKKALVLLFVVLIAGASLYSQDPNMDLMRADLKTQKTAIVKENMALTDAQNQVFWPIYKNYDAKLTTINDQVIALIKDYGVNFNKMTDAKASELMKKTLSLMGKRVKLLEGVCNELAKAIDPIVAAKFMQVERRITAAAELQVAGELPFIKR
jgi:hypothetical protein